jgi:RimJ/RimL family protein N-acetyltransferase
MSTLTTEPAAAEPTDAEPAAAEPAAAEEARVAPFSHRASCGLVTLEPFDPEPYAVPLRRWLSHPASASWGMVGVSSTDVRAYIASIAADPHQSAWLGRVDGEPLFYVETYDPAHVLLTEVHDAEPGDVGMHLLVAPAPPPEQRVPGLTSAIMASVVRFVVERLGARRVVVEPDVENVRIAAKNDEVGFRAVGDVDLPDKRARLSVLTRDDAAAALARVDESSSR